MKLRNVLSALGLAMLVTACSHTGAQPPAQIGGTPPRVNVPAADATAVPQIVQLWISRDTFGSGDSVSGQVTTSSNAASVEARVGGFGMPMQRLSFGRFALTYRVPSLPSFVKRTFDLRIIARNARGDRSETSVPIHVR
jgi:hypothetical protein